MGTQVSFVPGFDMKAAKNVEWEERIVVGLLGFNFDVVGPINGNWWLERGICSVMSFGC
jgi:hypothetical protein